MRNLKKILALVLALMMVLSTMAIASAADFNDAAEIDSKYAEAVEVMAGLGILAGNPKADGTFDFNPKGTLTRAQAAKIASVILEGSTDNIDDVIDAVDNPFSDIEGWAKSFVLCAYSHGLVNGDGNGKFSPNRTLTGYEFGKMMLLAAGIGESKDYVGAEWKISVASALKANGLLAGVEVALSANLTREAACQIAWNAMNHGEKVYTITFNGTDTLSVALCAGQEFATKIDAINYARTVDKDAVLVADAPAAAHQFVVNQVKKGTLANEVFGLKSVTAQVKANAGVTNALKYTTIGDDNYAVATGYDVLGHFVTVYYQDIGSKYDPAKGYPVYALVDRTNEVKVSYVQYLALALSDNNTAELKALFGGVKEAVTTGYYVSDTAALSADLTMSDVIVFGNAEANSSVAPGTYFVYNNKVIGYKEALASDVTKVTVTVTDASKGYYTVTSGETTYVVNSGAKTDYNKVTEGNIDWMGLFPADKKIVNGSTASAMYVVATCGGNYHFSELETVVGKVTSIQPGYLTIDGEGYYTDPHSGDAYALKNILGASAYITNFSFHKDSKYQLNFNDTYTFYLDEDGEIFSAFKVAGETATVEYDMVYVLGTAEVEGGKDAFNNIAYTYTVQYFTQDGKLHTANNLVSYNGKTLVHTAADGKQTYSDGLISGWVELAETDKGIAIKPLDSTVYTVDTYEITEDTVLTGSSITLGNSGYLVTGESLFVYTQYTSMAANNKDAHKVLTGAHNSTLGASLEVSLENPVGIDLVLVKNASNDNLYDIVAAFVPHSFSGIAVSTKNVVYVLSYLGQTSRYDHVFQVMNLDGTVEVITVNDNDNDATNNGALEGTFCTKDLTATGYPVLHSVSTTPDAEGLDTGDFSISLNNPASSNYFVLNGVEYYNGMVVTGAKVVDLRQFAQYGLIESYTSLNGMFDKTVNATAIYNVDKTTGVISIGLIIVTD